MVAEEIAQLGRKHKGGRKLYRKIIDISTILSGAAAAAGLFLQHSAIKDGNALQEALLINQSWEAIDRAKTGKFYSEIGQSAALVQLAQRGLLNRTELSELNFSGAKDHQTLKLNTPNSITLDFTIWTGVVHESPMEISWELKSVEAICLELT